MIWRWSKNVDSRGRKLPEKGNDDFIDALMHALFSDWMILQLDDRKKRRKGNVGKEYAGSDRPEKRITKAIIGYNHNERTFRDGFF